MDVHKTTNAHKINIFTPLNRLGTLKTTAVNFLYTHLEEYGDSKNDITKAISYAMKEENSPGGFVVTCEIENQLVGVVVINKTGMKGYIPENILVYIATHKDFRGRGIGKQLMESTLKNCDGDVALHVEPDNPAKLLYEKIGFENKYLEMRYKNN